MTHDYLDKWLREFSHGTLATAMAGGGTSWGAQDTDPDWNWDSGAAVATTLANGATGEPPEPFLSWRWPNRKAQQRHLMKQRYEHDIRQYHTDDDLCAVIYKLEKEGWEVAAIGESNIPWESGTTRQVVFKRPVPEPG